LPNICRAFCRLAALVVLGYAVAMTPQTRSSLRIIRISAFALLALLVATMLGWLFLRPATGPAFALTSMNGERFDGSSLTGKPYAMFFGFTHCPDVCPTTMQELADTLGAVGAPAKDFTVLFVSVDPARDTKELMRSYLGAFDPRILGLTGEQTDIDAIVKRNGIVVERVGEGQSYTFNHTASVLLFDKNGQLAGTFSPSDTPDDRKKKLERLLAG
jgi:protein SCO1